MRRTFERYIGQTIDIIYLDRHNKLSQRRIRVLSVDAECMTAYCFIRKGPRLFRNDNILAVMPARQYAN
jgi:predicted DNA-binding transcriptional regulator YafY